VDEQDAKKLTLCMAKKKSPDTRRRAKGGVRRNWALLSGLLAAGRKRPLPKEHEQAHRDQRWHDVGQEDPKLSSVFETIAIRVMAPLHPVSGRNTSQATPYTCTLSIGRTIRTDPVRRVMALSAITKTLPSRT
jgi:hypothetical protein